MLTFGDEPRVFCSRLLLLLGLAAFSAGCGEPAAAETSFSVVSARGLVRADVHFEGPVQHGSNALVAKLSATEAAESATLSGVAALMPSHAHLAQEVTIEASDDGYRVSDLNLYMTGRWEVELMLTLAEEQDSVSFPVDVP